ncbi:DUF2625 domain-containing protein [Paenibacillus sp. MZ04-78.2]|uniref:DUF2625 family protein n=1 Tax=Paenibacillus sp. MZ04-78.2 TaxID=2962034 RepID=UPI0020B7D706|nr:DUF2625 family protein [Paenibacillus sp. MZ04-78.2]MCP3775527.1 DUF2625 domain-containing protein [Paenibacillus sp. MZ04-78.2]
MKSLDELIDESESTWLEVQDWVSKAANTVEILPANPHEAREVLHQLQITTRSVLGTVAYYTGGIFIENGWLRILGSGSRRLPRNLITWNEIGTDGKSSRLPSSFLIADDVAGGFFALNGGAFEGKPGDVFYFAPDTLEWESLDMGFSDFLYWACFGDVQKFYETFRWEGWVEEVRHIDGNQGVSIYPFLWADGGPVTSRARSVVPIEELWKIYAYDSKLK